MKLVVAAVLLLAASALSVEQDPCAGCDESLAQAYQACARDHGNPCAERDEDGLVTGAPGEKKDVSCCLKKQKHDRCLQCASMDCEFATCNVNKRYYSERTIVEKLKGQTKEAYAKFDKAAMKAAGWGL
mmetsp:Transcript_988/g.2033  ORF Transcript_988/g.2033 Transcript_988/m.2033 type:complete len:129 (+) Transcript_988:55-441(+)